MSGPERTPREIPGVVVVLSWFGKRDTVECVQSLLAEPIPATVLVVDNGSYDGVLDDVADRWPEVATLQTGRNLGYAGGMNAGLTWALESGATVITVLNNDTVIPPGVIPRLQELARDRMAVSPEVFYRDDPSKVWFGGASLDASLVFPEHVPAWELQATKSGLRTTELLAGCCVTASAKTWLEVGLFDERFFLNFEDSEWSMRARRRGIRLVVDCSIPILHSVSASFVGNAAALSTFYFVRNGLLFNRLEKGSRRSRLRFLRGKALLLVAARLRARQWRAACRQGLLVGWAIGCDTIRCYGAAPKTLQRIVARWHS